MAHQVRAIRSPSVSVALVRALNHHLQREVDSALIVARGRLDIAFREVRQIDLRIVATWVALRAQPGKTRCDQI